MTELRAQKREMEGVIVFIRLRTMRLGHQIRGLNVIRESPFDSRAGIGQSEHWKMLSVSPHSQDPAGAVASVMTA